MKLTDIVQLGYRAAECGGRLDEITLDKVSYDLIAAEIKGKLPIDIHEACGDYDRPSSPFYGSRPSGTGFQSIAVMLPSGLCRISRAD